MLSPVLNASFLNHRVNREQAVPADTRQSFFHSGKYQTQAHGALIAKRTTRRMSEVNPEK
jgi:hypothetical protein